MSSRFVYLMRGLPACGKSHAARRLAGEHGVICETDAYFVRRQADGTETYEYSSARLADARRWNFTNFAQAIAAGRSPIVVDRGNGRNRETREYLLYARERGYQVELREPDSPWWGEIRTLLRDPRGNAAALHEWAGRLAEMSCATHRVPVATILDWMSSWRVDLTVDEIAASGG